MKTRSCITTCFGALMFCAGMQNAAAQIDHIYFPHPNYLNHYLTEQWKDYIELEGSNCLEIDNPDVSRVGRSKITDVFSFNELSPIYKDSCTVYGIAACISHECIINQETHLDDNYYWPVAPYNNGFGFDIDLEVVLCEATPGDSLVRLVKKQVFSISKGQYPDKALHMSDTGAVRASVYEFYFDAPVTVKGTFLAGFRPMNEGDVIYGFSPINRDAPCIPGYTATLYDDTVFGMWFAYCTRPRNSGQGIVPDVENLNLKNVYLPWLYPIISLRNEAVDEVGEAGDGVEVSPNPSRGRAMVHSMRAIRSVEVCDMSGRVVLRKQVNGDLHTVELSVSLPRGCYVVRVVTVQGAAVKKLVVE